MVAILLLGEAVGIAVTFLTRKSNTDLSKDFAAGTATLFFGGLLGGVANKLIGEFDRRRVRRAADIDYILNLLTDLKAVYDQVDRGRTLISANRSAKTYGDEMKNLIEARIKLLQVDRALKFDERASAVAGIRSEVGRMEGYLSRLVEEFQNNYKETSRAQSVYEARMKKALDQLPLSDVGNAPLPVNTPWEMVRELEQVHDLLQAVPGSSGYSREFVDPLDKASEELRKALIAKYDKSGN
jgi:hypothetical protein